MDNIQDLENVSNHWLREIENFFNVYKILEGKTVETVGWQDRRRALEVIRDSQQRYRESLEAHD